MPNVCRPPSAHVGLPERGPRHHGVERRELFAVALLGISFTTCRALILGQDVNWDLRNYHYYSVYAWLNQRVTYNIAPAQLQSWLNPLVFLPHYWLINHIPPLLTGALFGALAGFDCILLYALSRCVISTNTRAMAIFLSILCTVVGLSGPEFLANLGTTSSDISVSIPVLAGLLAICWGLRRERNVKEQYASCGACGVLLGSAAGLKLTAMTFVLGLALTLVVLSFRIGFGARRFATYSAGGIVGFLLTGGYWSWFLWKNYSNPILPYYNTAFRSPWVVTDNFRDNGGVPRTVLTGLSYPFQWLIGLHPTSHAPLRDARFALLSVLVPLCLLAMLWRTVRKRDNPETDPSEDSLISTDYSWLLILFSVFSYVLWIRTFAIYRYLLPLDLISGLILLLTLDRLMSNSSRKIIVFVLLAAFSVAWSKPFPRERIPYGKKGWFAVQLSPAASAPNTLFVILQYGPLGYIVPFLPDSDRIIRINGNMPLRLDTRLGQEAMRLISQHTGPIRSLSERSADETDRSLLNNFGLVLDETRCENISTSFEQVRTCLIVKKDLVR